MSVLCAVCGLLLRGRGGLEEEVGGRQEPSQHAQGEQHPLHTAFIPAHCSPFYTPAPPLPHAPNKVPSPPVFLQHLQTIHCMHPCSLENLAPLPSYSSFHSNETLHLLQPCQPLDTNLLYPLYSTSLPLDTVHPCTSAPPAPLCNSCSPTAIFFRFAI